MNWIRCVIVLLMGTLTPSIILAWEYSEDVDELTKQTSYQASARDNSDKHLALVTCSPKKDWDKLVVMIGFEGATFESTRDNKVAYRFDDSELQEPMAWGGRSFAVYMWGETAHEFSTKLQKHNVLVFRAFDYFDRAHTATFSLQGSAAAISRVLEHC